MFFVYTIRCLFGLTLPDSFQIVSYVVQEEETRSVRLRKIRKLTQYKKVSLPGTDVTKEMGFVKIVRKLE